MRGGLQLGPQGQSLGSPLAVGAGVRPRPRGCADRLSSVYTHGPAFVCSREICVSALGWEVVLKALTPDLSEFVFLRGPTQALTQALDMVAVVQSNVFRCLCS